MSKSIFTSGRLIVSAAAAMLFASCNRDTGTEPVQESNTLASAAATASALTGLDFPSNGQTTSDIRFRFNGGNLPPMYPVTYVWKYHPRAQTGYYSPIYMGADGAFTGNSYYTMQPYPDGDSKSTGKTHKWGLGVYGYNFIKDANGHSTQLGYNAWYWQAFRAYDNGSAKVHEFFWNLPDTTKVIRYSTPRGYGNPLPSNAALNFGDAPWSIGKQRLSGILRGLQLYSVNLKLADVLAESNAPLSTSAGANGIWYLNVDPTPSDISDKSGKGHHPTWASSARPALWTADTTLPPPAIPQVALSANPTSVAAGGSSTLTWSSLNATSCAAGGAWSGSKALSGSQATAALSANSTFSLTCTGSGGSASASATVTVTQTPPPPQVTLSANPTSVDDGGTSTLTWSSLNATSCAAGGAWSGSKALSGSQATAALSVNSTFSLTCAGSGGSASASATVTIDQPGGSITGLDFPSNGPVTNDVRFRFRGASLIPMYPATYIWRVNLRQQAGYYTTFFWGPDGAFTGAGYFGCHPYPDGGGHTPTSHKWEVSVNGYDFVTDQNGHSTQVAYGAWKTQAVRVSASGSDRVHEFFWDLPDTTKVIRVSIGGNYGSPPPSNPALTFGTAPWAPGTEHLSGILRSIQLYSASLSKAEILAEAASPLTTTMGTANIWYLNANPTPSDISDKSGKGHHPEWVTSLRPALWTGP